MSNIYIKLNSSGIQALLKSEEVSNCLETHCRDILSKLDGDYAVDVRQGQKRSIAEVKTTSNRSFYRNLHTNELLKAMKSGGRK